MRKIVTFPNPILRKKSKKIEVWGKEEEGLLTDLKRELTKSKIGIGLSALQVGVNKTVFIAQKDIFFPCQSEDCAHQHGGEYIAFVNPVVKDTFGEKSFPLMVGHGKETEEFMEGCLSFPDLYGSVKRFLKIEVSYQKPTAKGPKLIAESRTLEGLAAIVFQHELDHLSGVLFIDHLKKEERELFRIDKEGKKTKIDLEAMLK